MTLRMTQAIATVRSRQKQYIKGYGRPIQRDLSAQRGLESSCKKQWAPAEKAPGQSQMVFLSPHDLGKSVPGSTVPHIQILKHSATEETAGMLVAWWLDSHIWSRMHYIQIYTHTYTCTHNYIETSFTELAVMLESRPIWQIMLFSLWPDRKLRQASSFCRENTAWLPTLPRLLICHADLMVATSCVGLLGKWTICKQAESHFQTAALDHTLNLHHQPGALMPTIGTRMGAATPVLRAALPTGARTGVLARNLQRFVLRKWTNLGIGWYTVYV